MKIFNKNFKSLLIISSPIIFIFLGYVVIFIGQFLLEYKNILEYIGCWMILGAFGGIIIGGMIIGIKQDNYEIEHINSLSKKEKDYYVKNVYIPKHNLKNKIRYCGR